MILVKRLTDEEVIVLVTKKEEIIAKASFQGKSAFGNADLFAYYYSRENAMRVIYEGV